MTVLLLSGGVASACVGAWRRPDACLFIDQGQASAPSARAASRAVAQTLGAEWAELTIDCTSLRLGGSLAGGGPPANGRSRVMADLLFGAPAARAWPDGWPFRNQLLVTFAAAWAGPLGYGELMLGAGTMDAEARPDGGHLFFRRADQIVRLQPGELRVTLPALGRTLAEVAALSRIGPEILRLTYGCEVAAKACESCWGCLRREALLRAGGADAVALPAR